MNKEKLKIVILTSSINGTASYFIPIIFENANVEIVSIIVNQNQTINTKKSFKRRLSKIFKIGLFGAINGIRMRKWFSEYRDSYLPKNSLISYCKENNIKIEYTPTINCTTTIELFNKTNADIGISVGNSYIGKKIFSIPKFGMINTHGEILPDYQNGQSVIWQIYNKSNQTGFTIHKINSKIDQGEIMYQEKFDIEFRKTLDDTVAFNCAKITKKAALGLSNVLNNFEYYFSNSKIQGKGNHYTTPTFWQYLRIWNNYRALKKGSCSHN